MTPWPSPSARTRAIASSGVPMIQPPPTVGEPASGSATPCPSAPSRSAMRLEVLTCIPATRTPVRRSRRGRRGPGITACTRGSSHRPRRLVRRREFRLNSSPYLATRAAARPAAEQDVGMSPLPRAMGPCCFEPRTVQWSPAYDHPSGSVQMPWMIALLFEHVAARRSVGTECRAARAPSRSSRPRTRPPRDRRSSRRQSGSPSPVAGDPNVTGEQTGT